MQRLILILSFLASIFPNYAFAEDPIVAGKAKSSLCATCHGSSGNGEVNPLWPKLADQHAQYTIKQLRDFKLGPNDGRNNAVMYNIAINLSEADVINLALYYQSLPRTLGFADPALVELGQRLYRGGDLQKGIPACAACHEPSGLGNGPARFPLLSGQDAAYVVITLKAFRDGTRTNDPNHMMRDIAAKMSDQEMSAVASYISGLH